jgi:hypothetical protein
MHRLSPALDPHHSSPPLDWWEPNAVDLFSSAKMTNPGSMMKILKAREVEVGAIDKDIEGRVKGFEVIKMAGVITQHPVIIRRGAGLGRSICKRQSHPEPEKSVKNRDFRRRHYFCLTLYFWKNWAEVPLRKRRFFIFYF